MAVAQKTVQIESAVTLIRIEPGSAQLIVEGVLRIAGTEQIVATFSEAFTPAQLPPLDVQAAQRLVASAQGWIDAKLSAV